jgi:hypothetical protein
MCLISWMYRSYCLCEFLPYREIPGLSIHHLLYQGVVDMRRSASRLPRHSDQESIPVAW